MRYVIIGASAAGIRAAEKLRALSPASEITVVSRDRAVYSRCMLHLRLAGERDDAGISFVDADFFDTNRITWLKGETVTGLDTDAREIALESGGRVPYDKLLIASGARASVPPVPNLRGAENVFVLRNLEDVAGISDRAEPGARAVIVGGGLVGVDAAVGLLERGVGVTLVEMAGRILTLQLDDRAAARYARLLEDHGAAVVTGAQVREAVLDDAGRVRAILLGDGRSLPCDFCVVAAGVAPNIDFIPDGALRLTENRRALAVDRRCRTSAEDVYAAGDVTFIAPIWPEAVRQAEVAALNMAGEEATLPEDPWALTNSMNFYGLPTVSYGHTAASDPSFTEEIYTDGDVYRKVIHRDGVIQGVIFQGDIDNCGAYLRLVRDKVPVGDIGKSLLRLSYADFFQQAANGEFL